MGSYYQYRNMNRILKEDIESFSLPDDIKDTLSNSTIVLTGATGLVGSAFVRCLSALQIGIRFILPVRNREKTERMLGTLATAVTIVETDISDFFRNADFDCDYIVHCAGPTNGKYMSTHPVETFTFTIDSTREILEYARRRPVKGIVYLSSIEYYGQIFDDLPVTEERMGIIDRNSPRSSYALGKQAAEYLNYCYATEYGIPVMNARLTQTFGAGLPAEDSRVFAQFAKSVIKGDKIVLHTEGKSAKPYCYTTDCVSALVYILTKATPGESYNVAKPGSYISIRDLAMLCRDKFGPSSEVIIESHPEAGYAPDTTVNLCADKLLSLGWQPKYGLEEMLRRLIEYMKTAPE